MSPRLGCHCSKRSWLWQFLMLLTANVLFVFLTGCGPLFKWRASNIPTALDSDDILRVAAQVKSVPYRCVKHGSTGSGYSLETERHFDVTASAETRGQLIAEYRALIKRTIEASGGKINGSGSSGNPASLNDFSFEYIWSGNAGVIHVYSFDGSNETCRVISLCYEHHK